MLDSITMAEVGSIVKVSGSKIATPLGPPRPGSTPTKMPSTSPTIIRAIVFHVISTTKPCSKRPNASMDALSWSAHALVAEGRFERPLRHDDVKCDIESHEHDSREQKGSEQRFPQREPADHPHEDGDQQKTRDIHSKVLRGQAEQQRRYEHRHDAPQLRPRDKGFGGFPGRQQGSGEPIEAGEAEDHRKIKRKVTGLRAGRVPGDPGAPIVEAEN